MNDHFDKIFWYIVGMSGVAMTYVFIITFIPINEKNLRFADTALGFMLGTIVSSSLSYLIGGSPTPLKKLPLGGTTAEVTANITTTPESSSGEPNPNKEPE